jgi:hypothetical protein
MRPGQRESGGAVVEIRVSPARGVVALRTGV